MRAALIVFGLALVTGQQFQENYETTSTAVVLAGPGYFQRHARDFQRPQFSNDFQEDRLSGTRQNLQAQNYRGNTFQKNLFASSLFRSSDGDRFQNFDDQFISGGFRQRERGPVTSRYGRYQEDQRRRFQQNDRQNVFQQNNQDFFQQRYQDNQFQRSSQQNRFAQNSRGNQFDQVNQENRFQLNRPRSFFQLNNQDNLFQQNSQESRFNLRDQADRFQLNRKDARLRISSQDNFSRSSNRNNGLSSAFVEETRPFHSSFSAENSQRNSFGQQGQRFRGSHFDEVNSRFLERDSDLTSLPAGARFHLESVDTSFQCAQRPYGFYADQSSGCRVFHVCNPDIFVEGRPQNFQSSFMCGEGFIFDQRRKTCVQEHLALPCHEASNYYFAYDN